MNIYIYIYGHACAHLYVHVFLDVVVVTAIIVWTIASIYMYVTMNPWLCWVT